MPVYPLIPAVKQPPPANPGEFQWGEQDMPGSQPSLADMPVEVIRGLLSSVVPGVDTPDTWAGRSGLVVGTAAPAIGAIGRTLQGGPAVDRLLQLINSFTADPVEAFKDPRRVFLGAKMGSNYAPPPVRIKVNPDAAESVVKVPEEPVVRSEEVQAKRTYQEPYLKAAPKRDTRSMSEKLKEGPQSQAVKSVEELKDITPPAGTSKQPPASLTRARSGRPAGSAKLTPDIVRLIRARHAHGVDPRISMREFGIKDPTYSDIVKRNSWAFVKDEE